MSAKKDQDQEMAIVAARLQETAIDDVVDETTEMVIDKQKDEKDDEKNDEKHVERHDEQNDQQNDGREQHTPPTAPDFTDFPFIPNVTLPQALITSCVTITEENSRYALELVNAAIETVTAGIVPPLLISVAHDLTEPNTKTKGDAPATVPETQDITDNGVAAHTVCAGCSVVLPRGPEPGANLLACSNCKSIEYCSKGCQIEDWQAHKCTYCINPDLIPSRTLTQPTAVLFFKTHITNPFTRLSKGIWLHDRHKNDVYALLIDSFRLREDDDFRYADTIRIESVYNGRANSLVGFRRFINQAEAKKLLPPWWSAEKHAECDKLGLDRSSTNYHALHTTTRDTEIFLVYSDPIMIVQLRMFAEEVYGSGPAGTDGRFFQQKMVVAEAKARATLKK